MAITYPLALPTVTGNAHIAWSPRSIVAVTPSPFTGTQQTYAHQGQWWEVAVTLPPMKDAAAGEWEAFFLALNGREGSFYLGDSVRKTPLGTIAGSVTVGASAAAFTTTLPLSGGTGEFAVGDWLQVGTGSTRRLHRVTQVNAGSVDVFPKLRSAYANGTAITYNNPSGVFKLTALPSWSYDRRKICDGLQFMAMEVLT